MGLHHISLLVQPLCLSAANPLGPVCLSPGLCSSWLLQPVTFYLHCHLDRIWNTRKAQLWLWFWGYSQNSLRKEGRLTPDVDSIISWAGTAQKEKRKQWPEFLSPCFLTRVYGIQPSPRVGWTVCLLTWRRNPLPLSYFLSGIFVTARKEEHLMKISNPHCVHGLFPQNSLPWYNWLFPEMLFTCTLIFLVLTFRSCSQ